MRNNKLKELREKNNISLRELSSYTNISNPVLCYLENGTRLFRQEHIDILCSFFKVSSDYLLGRSENGIIVHYENGDEIEISQSEFYKYESLINSEIIYIGDCSLEIVINNKDKIILPKYIVYREIKLDSKSIEASEVLLSKISSLCKTMTSDELGKTIRFIEDYIIKK